MSLNAGLTTLTEDDLDRHRAIAQSLVTRFSVLEDDRPDRRTALGGTGRRFVSTVSTGGLRRSREVEFSRTVQAVRPDDPLLSPEAFNALYRVRRAIMIGLAIADNFERASELETLKAENARAPLEGEVAQRFRALLSASAFVASFAFAAYLLHMLDGAGEPVDDTLEPPFEFDTPHDAMRALVAGADRAIENVDDPQVLAARLHAFARVTLEGLIQRKSRFSGLSTFENAHIRLDSDDFTIDGFEVAPGERRKPLVMTFKKPEEIIGNHIAKYQAMKLAKMLMAYDFDRQMNPFVELGGFLFTFIGDGMPGTGKTILIQMLAGLVHDYAEIAGYAFHYENFGVDQISSYQGKSGQNCKAFIDNVVNPRCIGFGTIDDVDQVTAKRSDDRASAGQHEVTAVLMESFAGASTVVRGNCTFGMFSNYPEAVDDALRQRAGARWLVDGPQSREDYVDIVTLLLGSGHDIPLGDHDLYAGQEIRRAVMTSYAGHDRPKEDGLMAVWQRYHGERDGFETLADIGAYLHEIKQAEPGFTGRAIKNITDAIKLRAMDVELPDDWFERPETFMHKGYEDKKAMIEELRGPITLDMVVQEINRYADSEFRYADHADETAVADLVRNERLRERAAGEIAAMQREGRWQT